MAVNLTVDPLFTLLPKESIQVQDAPAGPWRTVDAFVDRLAPDEMLGANMGDRPRFEVEFRNDAVLGVAAGFDRGQTTFCVAQRYGGTPDPTSLEGRIDQLLEEKLRDPSYQATET